MNGFPQYLGEDYNSQLPCWLSKNADFERGLMIPAAMGATDPLPLVPDAKNILVEGIEEELRGKSLAKVTQWRDEKFTILKKVIYE